MSEDPSRAVAVPRVLVVDDDADMARCIADALTEERCRCEVALDGASALEAHRRARSEAAGGDNAFDAVVSDVRMSGMDGVELMQQLRAVDPSLPVILITAVGSIPSAVFAVKSGAFDYVTKPCDGPSLRLAVDRALAARPPREGAGPEKLETVVRGHVDSVLARTGGSKAEAARILGVDLSTLYRWQRKWSTSGALGARDGRVARTSRRGGPAEKHDDSTGDERLADCESDDARPTDS